LEFYAFRDRTKSTIANEIIAAKTKRRVSCVPVAGSAGAALSEPTDSAFAARAPD
jgi:hypothetical protein